MRNELADEIEAILHERSEEFALRGCMTIGRGDVRLLHEAAAALRDVGVTNAPRRFHCELCVSRSLAPDRLWHWTVIMPDGHIYAAAAGFASLASALTHMMETGRRALTEADEKWRAALSPKAAPSGDEK